MKFGRIPLAEAEGAILAHSLRLPAVALKKGRLLSATDVEILRAAGYENVQAAILEEGDVHEDEAARRIAALLAGPGAKLAAPFTGRVNLVADENGLCLANRDLIDTLNHLDESITVATLASCARVNRGDIIATIKIIPFAAPAMVLARAERELAGRNAISVAPFRPLTAAFVTSDKQTDKTLRVTKDRLERLGSRLVGASVIASDHTEAALSTALKEVLQRDVDLVLVQGRSATVDRHDVVPAAIVAAGGRLTHFGMPVDPGNLLALAQKDRTRIIILPGCAGSPKENGFDWVLERLAAGLDVDKETIQSMGVGGLLKETARGQPRAATSAKAQPRLAGILLAAGQSRRMGRNKLVEPVGGKPLIRYAAETLANTALARRLVVVGHDAELVEDALAGLSFEIVQAPRHAEGMSHSLRAGLRALGGDADGALILLGDMPALKPSHLKRLIDAFSIEEGRTICVPTFAGRWGNPVLFASNHFGELSAIEGDVGGRAVVQANSDSVVEVAMPDDAIFRDVDTPEALAELQ